jgi:hypothetical protein
MVDDFWERRYFNKRYDTFIYGEGLQAPKNF